MGGVNASLVIVVRAIQSENALAPISLMDEGMVTVLRFLHPANAYLGMDFKEFPIVSLSIRLQFWNALFPIVVTEFGIVTLVRLQSENAFSPIEVTELGIVQLERVVQPENALFPIVVTELGSVQLERLEQPEKAPSAKVTTELPNITVLSLELLLNQSLISLQLIESVSTEQPEKAFDAIETEDPEIVMSLIPLQLRKELFPTEVTELGRLMLVKPLQPENALSPIEVTDEGKLTLVRFWHPAKALAPIVTTELPSVTVFSLESLLNQSLISLQLIANASNWHPENASVPTEATDAGIVSFVRPVQPEKASLPTVDTELGIVNSPFMSSGIKYRTFLFDP